MAEQQQTTARPPRTQRGRDNRRGNEVREEKQFEELVINIDRVARVVKGGRRFRFKALVVVGDRKNKVGVGVSKGQDVQTAIAKAADVAKKNMITIPVVNETILMMPKLNYLVRVYSSSPPHRVPVLLLVVLSDQSSELLEYETYCRSLLDHQTR
jgi:hypothetical protein